MTPSIGTRIVAMLLGVFFLLPTIVVMGASVTDSRLVTFPPQGFTLRWYADVLTDPAWIAATLNSLQTGLLAALLAVVVGTLLALVVARGRGVPRGLVTALATAPVVVPLVIVGLSTYLLFVQVGLVGSVLGLALAHAALGVPFVFVNVLTQLTALDPKIEDAARSAGANEATVFFRVILPLISGGMFSGALLAFVTSWDEVVIAIFMGTPDFHTLPIEIYGQLRSGVEPSTAAVSTLVTLVSVLTLLVVAVVTAMRNRKINRRRKAS